MPDLPGGIAIRMGRELAEFPGRKIADGCGDGALTVFGVMQVTRVARVLAWPMRGHRAIGGLAAHFALQPGQLVVDIPRVLTARRAAESGPADLPAGPIR